MVLRIKYIRELFSSRINLKVMVSETLLNDKTDLKNKKLNEEKENFISPPSCMV